ncbi:hypothetical protein ACFE04_017772 [Oxalis oulophora]
MEYRCVQCGFKVNKLFVQYSPGNIRLMKCENCKEVADEYIECEFMIILIDLILHKRKAYRHLLYNVLHEQTMDFKGLIWNALTIKDRSLLLRRSEKQSSPTESYSSFWIWHMLLEVLFGNVMLFSTYLFTAKTFLDKSDGVSRVVKLICDWFFPTNQVWEFPASAIFIIDLFVLSSNTVALKVLTESSTDRCIGTCVVAHAVKLLTSQVSRLRIFHPAIIFDYETLSSF